MPYANNKGADQPAHPHSLISTFVVHCLNSIIPLVSISEISSLYLVSVAVQAGLSLGRKPRRQGLLVMRLKSSCSDFRIITTIILGVPSYSKTPKNLDTPRNAVITLKFEQLAYHRVMHPKDADRMANSVDPDQTLGAV